MAWPIQDPFSFSDDGLCSGEFAEDPFFEWDIETKGLIPAWVEEAMNKASTAMDNNTTTTSSTTTSSTTSGGHHHHHHSSPSRRPPTTTRHHKSALHKTTTAPLAEKTLSAMEKTMDDEVETVLRDWNENVKRREKETFQVRPLRTSSQRSRGGTPSGGSSTGGGGMGGGQVSGANIQPDRHFGEIDPKAKFLNIERVHERDSVGLDGGSDEHSLDSSSESIEEDMKRPLYVTCPRTGRKLVRMQFDVHGFDSRDIKVKAVGRKVVIFAVHKETDSGRKSTNEFCRKINLPEDVDVDRLQCTFSNGVLCLEAPATNRPTSLSGSRQSVTSTGSRAGVVGTAPEAPLNQPFVKASEMGQVMHINVEVGRVFKADDVVVKLRGSDKLIVTATRQEETDHNSLSASLKREFRLPRRIHPHSLRAGLTNDGILNVTAVIDEAVLLNGTTSTTATTARATTTTANPTRVTTAATSGTTATTANPTRVASATTANPTRSTTSATSGTTVSATSGSSGSHGHSKTTNGNATATPSNKVTVNKNLTNKP